MKNINIIFQPVSQTGTTIEAHLYAMIRPQSDQDFPFSLGAYRHQNINI